MRGPLAKKLRSVFQKRMKTDLPYFNILKDVVLPPGLHLYSFGRECNYCFYILLFPNPKRDNFTIEISFSSDGIFPRNEDFYKNQPIGNQYSYRLPELFTNPPRDYWWSLVDGKDEELILDIIEYLKNEMPVEEALTRVEPMVDEAFQKIQEYAIPYFRKTAKVHDFDYDEMVVEILQTQGRRK